MRELLKTRGYKVTPARVAILDMFSKKSEPLDTETVYRNLLKLKGLKGVNEATVYRTISLFERGGILRRVDLRKDSIYFELGASHHHHIVCTKCSEIEDFESGELEKLLQSIADKSLKFKNIKDHSLELFGLCRLCS